MINEDPLPTVFKGCDRFYELRSHNRLGSGKDVFVRGEKGDITRIFQIDEKGMLDPLEPGRSGTFKPEDVLSMKAAPYGWTTERGPIR
jgi:hypothetical protein